ncbi:MFS transporter [Streptomyces spiramyceticus]|uniref:MFS transporter n=1 Tax=Streptomyces spiramyceticus TaxID=299717 RepID=UPI00237B24DE|nr:MFS transporter [Streptomyces spiramyceticus]
MPRIPLRTRLREAGAPLAVRSFRLHFTARMLSWTGSAVAPIGMAFAVLHLGGGASGLGLVLAANVAPQILLLLIGGVVADRWSRATVMVWTNILSAGAQGVAAVLLWTGAAQVWHLVAVSALCGAASSFFTPAAGGVVVEVVPAEMRYAANALLKIGQNTVKIAGPAVGGVLVAAVGSSWVIGWDAFTFAAAAVLCARLNLAPTKAKVRTGFVADLREGWGDFWSRRWLWVMVLQGAVVVPVWLVGYQMLGPVYGENYLGGAAGWGWWSAPSPAAWCSAPPRP